MDELIEDLLSLARHGRTVGDPEPVDLSRLVREAWEAVDTAGATLECSVDVTITADEGRVRALFENLFRNSVEHGSTSSRPQADDSVEHGSTSPASRAQQDAVEHGSTNHSKPDGSGDAVEHGESNVTVTVGSLEDDSTAGFYVADDGSGLETDTDEIFEFGHTTADGGTGLGLAIVDGIAEAHGWTVSACESDRGGARFEIRGVSVLENASVGE
ncbi:sensor histidine kinase [Natronorubrum sp. FCH18a]|uniref:sensor histidine kinase n=1 Tax=Natronorubrum sp. FCH18a TaxID=3447018 RepID=UPI003F5174E0